MIDKTQQVWRKVNNSLIFLPEMTDFELSHKAFEIHLKKPGKHEFVDSQFDRCNLKLQIFHRHLWYPICSGAKRKSESVKKAITLYNYQLCFLLTNFTKSRSAIK